MHRWIVSLVLLAVITNAEAVVVFDAANYAQNKIAAINSARSLLNQAKELEYQLSVYKNDLKNIAHYPQGVWGDHAAQLKQLADINQRGQALSYNMNRFDAEFEQRFPGYQIPQNDTKAYQQRSQSTLATLKNSLSVAGAQNQQMMAETQEMQKVQALSTHAQGHLQAQQAANMYADAQVGQLQKMRQLLMTQMNAQNTFYANQLAQEQSQAASTEKWLKGIKTTMPRYGSGQGFGREQFHL
jgi:P-type conjugative transfer protein TrbJ